MAGNTLHDHVPTLEIGSFGALIATQLYFFYAQQAGGAPRVPDPTLKVDPMWATVKQQAAQLVTDMESWASADLMALNPPPPAPPAAPTAPIPAVTTTTPTTAPPAPVATGLTPAALAALVAALTPHL